MANELDSMFEAYAKQAEAEKSNKKSGTSFTKNYEEIEYTGLEPNVPKVLRFVGPLYGTGIDQYTARNITIAKIVDDDGKKFRVIRPSYEQDPDYILNKIISKVKQAKWVNKEKTFPIKEKYPEIYNIVDKNGLQKTDPQYNYDKGWTGQEVLIANVIDREQMPWHKEHKHTMLLAKSVNVDKNGNKWPEEGISWYSVENEFPQLFKYYKSWENYDVAITRTGNKERAYIIDNATKNPERVEGPASQYISMTDHLTDEEKSWERYDLDKLFRVTTATKIYNRLKRTIARIDAALGTDFGTELKALVDEEKVKFDEMYGKNEEAENTETTEAGDFEDTDIPSFTDIDTAKEAQPVARAAARRTPAAPTKQAWESLPHPEKISDELKKEVISVEKADYDGTEPVTNPELFYKIGWTFPISQLATCPTCGSLSPLDATDCPVCGAHFI